MSKAKDEGKRFRILEAAKKIFAEKGFTPAKISEIARDASVADGTIYLYFKNKDELLTSVFEHNLEQLIPQLQNAFANVSDPIEQLHVFVETYLKHIGHNPDLSRVFQVELQRNPAYLQDIDNPRLKEYLEILDKIITAGQERKVFRSGLSTWLTKRFLFGALNDLALNWAVTRPTNGSGPQALEDLTEEICDLLTEGLAEKNQGLTTKRAATVRESRLSAA